MWLEIYHPELCDSPSSSRSSKEVTGPSKVLGRRQVFNKASTQRPIHKPSATVSSTRVVTSSSKGHSFLSDLLRVPTPPAKLKHPTGKSKVLTSADNLKLIEEKKD